MEANFTFANWLSSELRIRGETRQNIAETAGIPLRRLARLLDGREFPRVKCCEKLARALKVPLGIVIEAAGFSGIHSKEENIIIFVLPFISSCIEDFFEAAIRFA